MFIRLLRVPLKRDLCVTNPFVPFHIRTIGSTTKKGPYDESKMPFYALGVNLGKQIHEGGLHKLLDKEELDIVLSGFGDTVRGTSKDIKTVLQTYEPAIRDLLQKRSKRTIHHVKDEGVKYIQNFLDLNKDAIKTDTGMVYCSMMEGKGIQPTVENTVEVHYHGTLIDGTVFDSSVDRGQTISFPLTGVIKGWQQGLILMKEGGKSTIVIPPELAYGEEGSGVVPPGATLKFDIELFKVFKAK